MKNKKQVGHLNNYIDNKYFRKINVEKENANNENKENYNYPYPFFTVKLSIDFLILSIMKNADQYKLCDILTSIGFKSVKNYKLNIGKYQMKWIFKNPNNGIKAEMLYNPNPKTIYLPSLQLKMHDADQEVVNLLNQIFIKQEIKFNLSFVELTFDFFTEEVSKMQTFLEGFTFMKYARSKLQRNKTTYYLNNLRKSVRGMRIYFKKELNCVRMEVTLKSLLLKRLGLSLPLSSVDSLDLTNFFLFKKIDLEPLRDFLIWSNKKLIENLKLKRSGYENLVICQIDSWINCIVYDERGGTNPLMVQIAGFKNERGIESFGRFLLPYDDFSKEFAKQISGQKFLN